MPTNIPRINLTTTPPEFFIHDLQLMGDEVALVLPSTSLRYDD
jgi:hypothetical protein